MKKRNYMLEKVQQLQGSVQHLVQLTKLEQLQ